MHPDHPQLRPAGPVRLDASRRGSALGACLVVAVAMTVVLAGLLRWAESEVRLARQTGLAAKAGFAAEATGEFGLAQINSRLQQSPIIATSAFTSSGTPPVKPDAALLGTATATVLNTVGQSQYLNSAGLIPNVIGLLGGLVGGGTSPGRYVPASLNLAVGPVSGEQALYANPGSPLYAQDPLRGQNINARTVTVLSAARVTDTVRGEKADAYCEHVLQVRDSPLFGFISFYNMDLELSPSPYMVIHGPVHTNGNLYVCSGSGLHLYGVVTTAKGVYHGRAPGSGMTPPTADVTFKGAGGGQVSLSQGGSWLQSSSPTWTTQALTLWGGNLLSGSHGITPTMPASVPTYTPDDPATPANELNNGAHKIIEAATPNTAPGFPGNEAESQKYASKACLVMEITPTLSSGVPTALVTRVFKYVADGAGTYVRLTGSGLATHRREELAAPAGLITLRSFYDARQAQTVYAADLDVGVLRTLVENDAQAAQWTNGSVTFSPATEWNGVVYAEYKGAAISASRLGAVRLVNARYVPNRPTVANNNTKGFTLATNGPLYLRGNFNADGTLPASNADIVIPEAGEPPASVAADAVTVLSNAWNDANSTLGLSSRIGSNTEIAAAIIAGTVPTNKNNNGTYSGGNHNLVRMLEEWSGRKLGYRSSMAVLYESEIATAPWTSNAYNAPERIYGLNQLFVQGVQPPGTPRARTYRRLLYRKLTEAQYTAALAGLGS